MSRIIFVPQFPTNMRYSQWWIKEFPKQFKDRWFDVVTLGLTSLNDYNNWISDSKDFAPITASIQFENQLIDEYMRLDLKDDDILFLSDLSFPGIFPHVLYHKRPKRMFAFCHATSINNLDYFENDSYSKFPVEIGIGKLFDKIFVGSRYHQNKLGHFFNTQITYLPPPPFTFKFDNHLKNIDMVSAARPCEQKVDFQLENMIERVFDTHIIRTTEITWESYYEKLNRSKILLSSAKEETFGYQIVDAINNNCVPLAPNKFSYPELLPKEYLYNDDSELINKIKNILENDVNVPELLCKNEMNNFYDVICKEMKGN